MNKKAKKYIFVGLLILVVFSFSASATLFVYCSHFYFHEAGHRIFGFFDNILSLSIARFVTTETITCPGFPFWQLPQQTRMISGVPTLSFTFGGTIFLLVIVIAFSLLFYHKSINKNKKYIFIVPIIFMLHEFVGNFLCGTDNFYQKAYPICEKLPINVDYIVVLIAGLLIIPFFAIFYPIFKNKFRFIRNKKRNQ